MVFRPDVKGNDRRQKDFCRRSVISVGLEEWLLRILGLC